MASSRTLTDQGGSWHWFQSGGSKRQPLGNGENSVGTLADLSCFELFHGGGHSATMSQFDQRYRAYRVMNELDVFRSDGLENDSPSSKGVLAQLESLTLKARRVLPLAAKVSVAGSVPFNDIIGCVFARVPAVVRQVPPKRPADVCVVFLRHCFLP